EIEEREEEIEDEIDEEEEETTEVELTAEDEEEDKELDKTTRKFVNWVYSMGLVTGVLFTVILAFLLMFLHVIPDFFVSDRVKLLMNKADEVDHYIDDYYWKDPGDDEDLTDAAMEGLVDGLGDKYAAYYSARDYESALSHISGDYVGIGIILGQSMDTGRKMIVSVSEGTPAEKAGLKEDDILVKVNSEDVDNMSVSQLLDIMDVDEGKTIDLTVERNIEGDSQLINLSVTAEKIVSDITKSKMLNKQIGYLALSQFTDDGVDQFKDDLKVLKEAGMKGLIIDLRDNGGGSLSSVVEMLNILLPKGKLITESYKNKEDKVYYSTDDNSLDLPMVVLVNGKSASASEVMAGCLQDREAAILVGQKTYGKGIVQGLFRLKNGAGLKLTTGEYVLPSGRSIHGKGLTPDKEVEYTGKSGKFGQEDDNQLSQALTILEEKIKE
ncbi:MAG: S41 family peptidase, partial [Eubacterium sp.]|nr:S41 family peptidase [Eubacterium sp.]